MDPALGYDRLAGSYQGIEWLVFGNQLQRARVALSDQLPVWQRLLLLGDGDGRLLERLYVDRCLCEPSPLQPRACAPRASSWSITSVDCSAAMLRRQQSRLATTANHIAGRAVAQGTVEFVQCDALAYTPEAQAYDVLVTPFFLDCFSHAELDARLPIWLSALRSDGVVLHIDFIYPKSRWQRPRAHMLLWAMHTFFQWQTGLSTRRLADPEKLLMRSGLCKVVEHISGRGMIAAQLWRFASSAAPASR